MSDNKYFMAFLAVAVLCLTAVIIVKIRTELEGRKITTTTEVRAATENIFHVPAITSTTIEEYRQ